MTRVHQLLPFCLLPAMACVEDGPGSAQVADDSRRGEPTEAAQMTTDINLSLQRLTDSIIDLPGVTGTAIGDCDGEPCITVLLHTKTAELTRRIPKIWDGFQIKIEETGEITPRGTTE